MRIAFATEGSRGDLQPMVGLAAHLVGGGHQVAFCGPPDMRSFVEEWGLDFRPLGTDIHSFLAENADALNRGPLVNTRLASQQFHKILREQFEALPKVTADADIIIGAGAQFAGASVAEAQGVPYRYVAYCPVLLRSAEFPPMVIPNQSLPRWMNRLAWSAFIGFYNRLLRGEVNRQRAILGLDPLRDTYRYLLTERPLLAADAALAPVPDDFSEQVDQVGYLLPKDETPLPSKLESFLEAGPPPVYLGFGSMMDSNPAETTRLLLEAVDRAGCRAIISRGWAGLGEGPLPDSVFASGPVPHTTLFPRLAVVVHHGGAGTTTTAARAGVPQIVVPHLLDQYYWGHRAFLLGVAPQPLARAKLCAEKLAELIAASLDNELLSVRARELAERLCPGDPFERAADFLLGTSGSGPPAREGPSCAVAG